MSVYLDGTSVLLNGLGNVATSAGCCCADCIQCVANSPCSDFTVEPVVCYERTTCCEENPDGGCCDGSGQDPVDCRYFYLTYEERCCADDELQFQTFYDPVTCDVGGPGFVHNCMGPYYTVVSNPYDRCSGCCLDLGEDCFNAGGVAHCEDVGGFSYTEMSVPVPCPDPDDPAHCCGIIPLHDVPSPPGSGNYYEHSSCSCDAMTLTFDTLTTAYDRYHVHTTTCTACLEGWTGQVVCVNVCSCCGCTGAICTGEVRDEFGTLQYNTCNQFCNIDVVTDVQVSGGCGTI